MRHVDLVLTVLSDRPTFPLYIANPKCISEMAPNVVELHPHIRGDTVLGKFRLISSFTIIE